MIQAIEASGFSVSGPSDSRAAEHGEPAWVCNARGALAAFAQGRLPHTASVDVIIPGLAPEFASEQTFTAAMHVSRLEQAIKAWHVADETYEDVVNGPLSAEHAAVCMLADLRHYCDAKGLDFAKLDRNAYSDYREHLANDRHFGASR